MSTYLGNTLISGRNLPDSTTIAFDSSNKLQTIGTKNSNANSAHSNLKFWSGTRAQYDAIVDKDASTLYNIIDDQDESMKFPTRNIGQIIESTLPLTDAGLHLLDGSLIDSSGIYADFVTYISGFVNTYPDLFETEANWQASVTAYGVCGKFVYDSVNNTVRLPKITGFTEGTIDPTVLGDLIEAGLPNITGEIALGANGINSGILGFCSGNGAISSTNSPSAAGYAPARNTTAEATTARGWTFNASNSSSIYGNSTTVQPQTIKVLYYIVLATAAITDIQVNINKVAVDLHNKAEIDLANVNATGKIQIAHNAMPSDTYIDLTLSSSGTEYTAPADGYIYISKIAGNTYYYTQITVYDSNNALLYEDFREGYSTSPCTPMVPIKKGQSFRISYNATGTTNYARFIYAQGCTS